MRKKSRDKWNNILVPQFRYHFVTILNANTLLRVWSHYIWTFTYQQSMHIICQTHTVHTFLATVITVKRFISFLHFWKKKFSLLLLPRFLFCPLLLFVTRESARALIEPKTSWSDKNFRIPFVHVLVKAFEKYVGYLFASTDITQTHSLVWGLASNMLALQYISDGMCIIQRWCCIVARMWNVCVALKVSFTST